MNAPDFRVAIDFGTTYTAIAFAKLNTNLDEIFTIDNLPEDRWPGLNGREVPTELWYPDKVTKSRLKRKWQSKADS